MHHNFLTENFQDKISSLWHTLTISRFITNQREGYSINMVCRHAHACLLA